MKKFILLLPLLALLSCEKPDPDTPEPVSTTLSYTLSKSEYEASLKVWSTSIAVYPSTIDFTYNDDSAVLNVVLVEKSIGNSYSKITLKFDETYKSSFNNTSTYVDLFAYPVSCEYSSGFKPSFTGKYNISLPVTFKSTPLGIYLNIPCDPTLTIYKKSKDNPSYV